ncbi:MAG TPA: feruloyl-CoA synthase, partial [Caulobacteraceae bacterium]
MHDGETALNAPFRDARYAPRALEVERRDDGEIVLFNPTPVKNRFQIVTGPLARWAREAPDRVWLAQREGDGWRTLTYGEAFPKVRAIAGGLRLKRGEVLLILARNGIDHA